MTHPSSNSVERDSGTTASPLLGADTTGDQRVEVAALTADDRSFCIQIEGRTNAVIGGYVRDYIEAIRCENRAAPELLAALGPCITALMFEAERAVREQDAVALAQIHDAVMRARAAITLATGGQS